MKTTRALLAIFAFALCSSATAEQPAARPPMPTAPAEAPFGSDLAPAPLWADLSGPERETLAPLASQFDALESQQRRKWKSLASRSGKWSPEQRALAQSRMVLWAKMTPEQRAAARQQALSERGGRQNRAESWRKWSEMKDESKGELRGKALEPAR